MLFDYKDGKCWPKLCYTAPTFLCPQVLALVATLFHKLQKLSVSHQILCCLELWNTRGERG